MNGDPSLNILNLNLPACLIKTAYDCDNVYGKMLNVLYTVFIDWTTAV